MADVGNVATGIYQPLAAPQQQQLGPLQVLQLIGQMQQNKLQQQDLQYRQNVGQAYKDSADPVTGQIDYNKFRQIAPTTGYRAGEAIQQGIQNESATADLDANYRQKASSIAGAYAGKPDLTDDDITDMKVAMSQKGVPSGFQQTFFAKMPSNPAARKKWLVTQSNLARGPEAVAAPVTVPGQRGEPVQIPESTAAYARSGGGLQTGMAPGFNEAQVQTGAGSGAALNDARQRGLNYRQEVFPLEAAIPALEKLGKTGTGPGTEQFNQIKSFLQSAGIPGLDADKIKNFDEAKKYLTDFVNQNGNTGTNDKLAAAFAGNPSVGVSNAAAVDVAKSALSLRRMKQAQLVEFEKSGLPDNEYTKWASQWNIGHDPRAFGFDLMTPEQRKKVIESLPEGKDGKPGPRDLFKLQVMAAHNAGIIKPPGQ